MLPTFALAFAGSARNARKSPQVHMTTCTPSSLARTVAVRGASLPDVNDAETTPQVKEGGQSEEKETKMNYYVPVVSSGWKQTRPLPSPSLRWKPVLGRDFESDKSIVTNRPFFSLGQQ